MANYVVTGRYVTLKLNDPVRGTVIEGFYQGAAVPDTIDPASLEHHLRFDLVAEVPANLSGDAELDPSQNPRAVGPEAYQTGPLGPVDPPPQISAQDQGEAAPVLEPDAPAVQTAEGSGYRSPANQPEGGSGVGTPGSASSRPPTQGGSSGGGKSSSGGKSK